MFYNIVRLHQGEIILRDFIVVGTTIVEHSAAATCYFTRVSQINIL